MTNRVIRYQGAIIRNSCLLLLKHREHASGRSYWVIPGGGREENESEEACVQREMLEETNLTVSVECLLLDELAEPGRFYQRYKTYLCYANGGEASPGYEPEPEAAQVYAIVEAAWFDLRHPETWNMEMTKDPTTFQLVKKIQALLEYPLAGS
jgi:8-oxo-dGTP pyrophosphatase MutT (NUDIX family)